MISFEHHLRHTFVMQKSELTGYAQIFSKALVGLEAPEVRVEVHISNGLPACNLVGLPEAEVRESRERVRSAIAHAGFDFPNRRITINLAPADLPKHSGRFDLPIALGILVASGQIAHPDLKAKLDAHEFAGELSLSGQIKPIMGGLALALAHARQRPNGFESFNGAARILVMPAAHTAELSAIVSLNKDGMHNSLRMADHLEQVAHFLGGMATLQCANQPQVMSSERGRQNFALDFADVLGQQSAKRALEIAAAGQHSALLIGSPGVGKSMLVQRLPSILPPGDTDEVLSRAAMLSLRGFIDPSKMSATFTEPAFRAPHHSASVAAVIGGGNPPKPGEISLAHGGVLFLDELAEFNRSVLEALREPLEAHKVLISRSTRHSEFPARFQLVAAMNPCPCGYLGHSSGRCHCTPERVQSYQARISGPLLDRIDLHITVAGMSESDMLTSPAIATETSQVIAKRVSLSRDRQMARQGKCNALLQPNEIKTYCQLASEVNQFAQVAIARLNWSGRAIHRVLKVARTIADLAESNHIEREHIAQAIQWRRSSATIGQHA
jgi:magnesium chelatase family protein